MASNWKKSYAAKVPTKDETAFYEWYTRTYEFHQHEARSYKFWASGNWGHLIYASIALLTTLSLWLLGSWFDKGGVLVAGIMALLYFFVSLWTVIMVRQKRKEKASQLTRNVENGLWWTVSGKRMESLSNMVQEVLTKMNMGKSDLDIEILICNVPSSFPSIESYNKRHYLILPVGFLILLKKDREYAISLVGHELAHIKIGDVDLWQEVSIAWFEGRPILVPSLLIQVCLGIILMTALGTAAAEVEAVQIKAVLRGLLQGVMVNFVSVFMTVHYYRKTKKARQRSEILADLMSAKFFGASNLLGVLEKYGKYSDEKGPHLPLPQRRRLLHELQAIFP